MSLAVTSQGEGMLYPQFGSTLGMLLNTRYVDYFFKSKNYKSQNVNSVKVETLSYGLVGSSLLYKVLKWCVALFFNWVKKGLFMIIQKSLCCLTVLILLPILVSAFYMIPFYVLHLSSTVPSLVSCLCCFGTMSFCKLWNVYLFTHHSL